MRRPGPGFDGQANGFLEYRRAPVEADFDNVLAGIGSGRREEKQEPLVQDVPGGTVADGSEDRFPFGEDPCPARPGDEDTGGDRAGPRAAQPDDADAAPVPEGVETATMVSSALKSTIMEKLYRSPRG